AREKKQMGIVEESYQQLINISRQRKEFEEALEYYDLYCELRDKRLSSEMIEKLSELKKKYEEVQEQLVDTRQKNSLITEAIRKKMNMSFIGRSQAIRKVYDLAMMAAKHQDTNVLITGESGTGKEIIANMIHFVSNRQDNLFIPVNCGSIPEALMESEFFGHKKGAFTGATADKAGYLQSADLGTLFLDEIGDMTFALQTKLLRVMENRKYRQLGSNQKIKSDFRLITATNKDINELISDNLFRVDLFYRINTIEIHIPPLRERRQDVEPLVHYFITHFARTLNKPVPRLAAGVIDILEKYSFPGNVRELRNIIERAMIISQGDTICLDDLKLRNKICLACKVNNLPCMTLEEMERKLIIETLDKTDHNIGATAKMLGIHYSTLSRKLKKLNLSKNYS
ncbi:MAG: sigma 54-interacting transcriptional regulator, partial [Candidatus Tenebribacter davisii]|nr:sigma 54-interacting transcriptional regulator [Candidatus Tenebribacter davisii]